MLTLILSGSSTLDLPQNEAISNATLTMAYSQAIGQDDVDYHFEQTTAGYAASNPAHHLTIEATEQTIKISIFDSNWRLTSDSPADAITVQDNRLTLHREHYDEWYVNGPVGLQQGFTLYEPSQIAFNLGGDLPATANGNTLYIGEALTFSGLMAYDAAGQAVPVKFDLHDNKLVYVYEDSSAVYPLTIDPWVQQQKLTATDGNGNDMFGFSVALNGDTALIGAHFADCPTSGTCGAAYVFTRSGTMWSQQAKLTASDAATGDSFGRTVALNGDTALVGAYGKVGFTGSAYIFTRSGTTWSQQAKLTASDAASGHRFGHSVALDADTALVGATRVSCVGGTSCGSAYVFTRSGSVWTEQTKLTPSDVAGLDEFGISVALSGDTALVGSYHDDDTGGDSGSTYIFTRSGSIWTEQAKLTAFDGAAGDEFGFSVALDGSTALIGARNDDDNGGNSGSAYVFTGSGSAWSQQAKLIASDAGGGDTFGVSVAITGDTALIGANQDDDGGSSSGSAYLFSRSGGIWSQLAKLTASDAAAGDTFGESVAISGTSALIGAPGDDCLPSFDCGSAYVFIDDTPPPTDTPIPPTDTPVPPTDTPVPSTDTPVPPTDTPVPPTDTPVPPTDTPVPPTDTSVPPTDTLVPPTDTPIPPTDTPVPPTDTSVPPTDTPIPPTNTPVPPTDTPIPPTDTSVPGTDTPIPPTDTPVSPTDTPIPPTDTPVPPTDTPVPPTNTPVPPTDTLVPSTDTPVPPTDTPVPPTDTPGGPFGLVAIANCLNGNLVVTISAGDGPFNISASAGINTPVNGVGMGTTTVNGPEKWDNVTVTETDGDFESINLGQFKCRSDERPVPLTPAHLSRTTNPFPLFSWTAITAAINYRVFVFDDKVAANRTVDIRQNSGGPTNLILSTPLPDGRLFWRVRGRQNRIWSLWSIRFTLFKDTAASISVNTPVPTIDLIPPPGPVVAPTFPPPPNPR
ncbi:MAG: FG-GAP repeat protein [Chloroflexi bacterium]|nr:FG-GAP repeat protein [Chloroflexota bacterium]